MIIVYIKSQNQIEEIEYSHIDGICLYIDIGLLGKNYYQINQQYHTTYILNNAPLKGSPLENENFEIKSQNYTRSFLYDEISINKTKANIFFYHVKTNIRFEGKYHGISFALTPKNTSFSLMHELKRTNQIKEMIYTIYPDKSRVFGEGVFYLGGVPSIATSKKYKYEFEVKGEYWGIDLHYVYFTNDSTSPTLLWTNKNYTFGAFQAGESQIYAPMEFIEFLRDTLFKQLFNNGYCKMGSINYISSIGIECSDDNKIFNTLPNSINFVLGDKVFQIELQNLFFIYKGDDGKMKKRLNILNNGKNQWSLGLSFIEGYVTSYNYDNKKITFYTDLLLDTFNPNLNKTINRMLLFLIIVELITGIIILLYIQTTKYLN